MKTRKPVSTKTSIETVSAAEPAPMMPSPRQVRAELREAAAFLNSCSGRALSLAEFDRAVEYWRHFPRMALYVRGNADLCDDWQAPLSSALLPGLCDLITAEAERFNIDSSPIMLTAKTLRAVGDAMLPDTEPPEELTKMGMDYSWPDDYAHLIAKQLPAEDQQEIRQAEKLIARVRAHLKMGAKAPPRNPDRGPRPGRDDEFFWSGEPLKLQPLDCKVLCHLWAAPNRRDSEQNLIDRVWEGYASNGAVKNAKNRLSRALLDAGTEIMLTQRRGYLQLEVPAGSEKVLK